MAISPYVIEFEVDPKDAKAHFGRSETIAIGIARLGGLTGSVSELGAGRFIFQSACKVGSHLEKSPSLLFFLAVTKRMVYLIIDYRLQMK